MATDARLRVLAAADVRAALPMARAIAAMRDAFLALSDGRVRSPLRSVLRVPETGSATLLMGAGVAGTGALGAKIVSVFPGNPARRLPSVQALALLLDWETGRPVALLDGTTLTAIRTGAVSGLATDLLASPDVRRVAVIGSGAQARTQLEAVCAVRAIERAVVYSRTREHAERYASEMAGVSGIPEKVEVADSAAAAASEADVVCVATSAATPVLSGEEVARGAHLNAIGSFTPEMIELDPALVGSSRLVVDRREAALAEAGEVIAALKLGHISEDEILELGDVVAGKVMGRRSADERTIFKSVGLAVQDVCAAQAAVETAVAEGLGIQVEI